MAGVSASRLLTVPGLLALTFDNLGEAADLERGLWPADVPVGRHPSVQTALPRLLDALDRRGLRATFCVEAVNADMYPSALREIEARGHEVAAHGWRHETWDELAPEREDALLRRARGALDALGLAVTGFRPPGGSGTPSTPRLLVAHGFTWWSPADDAPGAAEGLARIPFAWPLVDAYHVLPSFAGQRERNGEAGAPRGRAQAAAALVAGLDRAATAGGPTAVIMHPFLAVDEEGATATEQVLTHVEALARRGALRVGPARDVARALAAR
jgi:peptidoglycan/xylan/chitin deacetylase (PgdA/CDA1 family)